MSIREFADRIGVSDTAVHKAIKSGKISESSIDYSNPKRPKVNGEAAAAEWGKNWNPARMQTTAISEQIKVHSTRSAPKGKAVKVGEEPDESKRFSPEASKFSEVARKKKEIELQSSALDLQIKRGKYVDKEMVYKSLFVMGQEVRTLFQSLPDRIVDSILAAKDRHDAHSLLSDAINDALEQAADAMKRDFVK